MVAELTTALFPLGVHVLPGGKLPLRIYEPRYTRMVKEAAAQERPFCMCMLDTEAKPDTLMNMYPLVTEVKLVDFELLEDGFLGITVEGVSLRRITRVWEEEDGLKVGLTELHQSWQPQELQQDQSIIAEQLLKLYQESDSLSELGLTFDRHNASWLCQRWIELLPMKPDDKQLLIEQPDCKAALAFLRKAIRATGTC